MIKLFLTDIDGVLTDGGYCVPSIEEPFVVTGAYDSRRIFRSSLFFRTFNTRDFVGLKMLHDAGIRVAALTGSAEPSMMQFERAADYMDVYSGVQDKYDFIRSTFVESKSKGNQTSPLFSWEEISYIGDEINDARLLQYVGMAACPADAVPEIRSIVENRKDGFVLSRRGGDTCLREFIDIIRQAQNIVATWGNWIYEEPKDGSSY